MEENRSIVVLSLFDGMSCGQTALKELGIIPEIYYASEIDKHAIGETQLNFPNTIQLGSVTTVYVANLKHIDLLIGGSPCQSFSFAGKRKGMSTKSDVEIYTLEKYLELKEQGFEFEGQSYLFWEYMRILTDIRKYNPNVKFLLENVEMGNKWERVLSEAIGIYGVHINSALVSAQNRKRIYWTNIRTKQVGLFGEMHTDIPQPKDEGILLKDILEIEVPEKYYLSDRMIKTLSTRPTGYQFNVSDGNEKSGCIRKDTAKMGTTDTYIKLDKQLNPKTNQLKASCFTAGGNSGGNHSDMDLIYVAMRGRNPDNPSDRRIGSPTEQRLEPNLSGKTNCLTSVQKDNLVLQLKSINNRVEGVSFSEEGVRPYQNDSRKSGIQELGTIAMENTKTSCLTTNHAPKCIVSKDNLVLQINPSKESGGVQPYQQNRVYDPNGISPCLNTDSRPHAIVEINERQQRNLKDVNEKANTFLSTSWKGSQANGMTLVHENIICHNTMPRSSKTGKGGTGPLSRSDGKTYCLDTGQTNAIEIQQSRIRRLTPTEVARLQTVPDWYVWACSDSQIYRMCGNGWTIKVIMHIFSFLKF